LEFQRRHTKLISVYHYKTQWGEKMQNDGTYAVHTIFRKLIPEDVEKRMESFEKEVAEFLSIGYSIVGSGMQSPGYGPPNLIYALVTKKVST
jgi:hypothetical protein